MTDDRRQRTLAAIRRLQGLLLPAEVIETKPRKRQVTPRLNRAARRAEKFAMIGTEADPPANG